MARQHKVEGSCLPPHFRSILYSWGDTDEVLHLFSFPCLHFVFAVWGFDYVWFHIPYMITKCTSLGSFLHAGVNTYKPETASADVIFALSIQIPSKIEWDLTNGPSRYSGLGPFATLCTWFPPHCTTLLTIVNVVCPLGFASGVVTSCACLLAWLSLSCVPPANAAVTFGTAPWLWVTQYGLTIYKEPFSLCSCCAPSSLNPWLHPVKWHTLSLTPIKVSKCLQFGSFTSHLQAFNGFKNHQMLVK